MRKFKIIFCCVLAAVLTSTFMSACGGKEASTPIETSSSQMQSGTSNEAGTEVNNALPEDEKAYLAFQYVKSLINIDDYRDFSYNLQGESGKEYPYDMELAEENKRDYNFDTSKVIFDDGSTISLPCSMQDLEKQGWSCSDEAKEKLLEPISEIGNFSTAHGTNITFTNKDKKTITAAMYNYDTADSKKTSDCTCTGIILNTYENAPVPDFTVETGLNKNITLDELINLLGEPTYLRFSGNTGEVEVTYKQRSNESNSITCNFVFDSGNNTTRLDQITVRAVVE